MAWSKALTLSLHPFKSNNSSIFITNPIFSPSYSPFSSSCSSTLLGINTYNSNSKLVAFNLPLQKNPSIFINFICKAAEYKFSDPISEFAESVSSWYFQFFFGLIFCFVFSAHFNFFLKDREAWELITILKELHQWRIKEENGQENGRLNL